MLLLSGMKIDVKVEGAEQNTPIDGSLHAVEVLEGGDEFLEALQIRLNEIVRKPNGRFVITYIPGKPGAKTPPRIQ